MNSLWLPMLFSALRFQGEWLCPTPASVEQDLATLHASIQASHTAELKPEGTSVELALLDESGAVLARRELPVDAHCDRMAHVIAVLIASWESEIGARVPETGAAVRPGPLSTTSPLTTSTTPPVSPSTPPPAAGVAATAAAVGPTHAVSPPPSIAAQNESAPTPAQLEWRLGLGVLGSIAEYEAAIGALFFASLQTSESRFEGHVKAFFSTPRTLGLGPGSFSWARFGGSVGASFDLSTAPFVVQLQVDAALAYLNVQAQGFRVNRTQSAADPGVAAGLLGAWRTSAVEPWLGVWVVGWPLAEHALVTGTTLSRVVPQIEVAASIGAAWHLP
jgi:hypothetical protein